MDPRGIAELMPDWLERGCPIESPVTDDAFWYLFEKLKIAAPIMPPPLQNHGNYVISLGEFVRWMAPIVGEMGVDLFAEFAAARVLVENGRVVGVRTGDKGIDKNGEVVLPTSSATSSAPRLSIATPTGRPSHGLCRSANPVSTSSGLPAGLPAVNGTKMTL